MSASIQDMLEKKVQQTSWKSLTTYHEKEELFLVDAGLSLTLVGEALINKQTKMLDNWLSQQLIVRPPTQSTTKWSKEPSQTKFQYLVVYPFILIKEQTS